MGNELIANATSLYGLFDLLCAGILAGLEIGTLGKGFKNKDVRIMYWVLLSQSAFFMLDFFWVLVDGNTSLPVNINYLINACYFGTSGICAYIWLSFVDYKVNGFMKGIELRLILAIPTFVIAFLAFTAPWNGLLFTIGEGNIYQRGTLYLFQPIITYAYIIFAALTAVFCSSKHKLTLPRSSERAFVVFALIPIAGGLCQYFNPGLPVLNGCITMAIVYIYIILQREEGDNQRAIIEYLSNDYKMVMLVEGITGGITIYRGEHYVVDTLGKPSSSFSSFTEFVKEMAKTAVFEDDREDFIAALSQDRIEYAFRRSSEYYVDFRLCYGGEYVYCQMKLVMPDSDQIDSSMLVGYHIIDEQIKKEKQVQNELEFAREAAETANRTKSSFLFNMSHDIRTPMNAILGFANMAKKYSDDKEKVEECIDKVQTSGTHLLGLINDILDMARIESGKIEIEVEPVDVREAADRLTTILGDLARDKDIKLSVSLEDVENPYVYLDELHVNQILLNIISNAVKYTENGGKVDILIKEMLSSDKERARYRFVISDTGIGMTEEFLDHVFDSFERDKNEALAGIQGTGLGMSITKRLVDIMHGNIEVESTLGEGSTFTVDLEFKKYEGDFEALVTAEAEQEQEATEITLDGKRILLVDDNELNREIASEILAETGAVIEEAEDGVEAFDKVRESEPGYYDIVLMDVQMPRMNGYESTKAIRALENEALANIPIIAMTANAFDEDREDALEAGMNEHIAKPIDVVKLFDCLRKIL
ncbi:MAG: response regulator [Oscillospiraceae bacterium]|nr:response regulator [Candidatus Limimonas egerieequi]